MTARRRRPRGEGSIYQDGDGRWHGAIVWRDPVTGHRTRKVVSGKTQAVVRERLGALRAQLASTGRTASKTALGDYLDRWLEAERTRIRAATWRGRELHVRSYI